MIVVIDGRLYQWDTGRKVRIVPENNASITEVHCYYEGETEGYCVETTVEGDAVIAPIPNILLQENRTIEVCAVSITEDGLRTIEIVSIRVFARSKPPNYVYTETEVFNFNDLKKEIEDIMGDVSSALDELHGYAQSLIGGESE